MPSITTTILIILLLLPLAFCILIYYFFLLPPAEPRNIPSIPFYVALLPLFQFSSSPKDQRDLFKTHISPLLLRHGAVKIFFASRWNILVHHPSYLSEIFRNEDIFQKSGNQKKIPGSVLADFLGDNVISAHGAEWKAYRGVMAPGLQRGFGVDGLIGNGCRLRDVLMEEQERSMKNGRGGVEIQESFQRYTIANMGEEILGVNFKTLNSSSSYMHNLQLSIKRQIFKPIFLNFPFLDRLGIFKSRTRARALAGHFRDQLASAVRTCGSLYGAELEEKTETESENGFWNRVGGRLLQARMSGILTEEQFRDNLTISFVAGQENPQLGLISAMYLLAKNPKYQNLLYQEISVVKTPSAETLQSLPLLTSIILETLRLLPPIGQLINRQTSEPTTLTLGSTTIYIPPGTYLGYNSLSTNTDPQAWHPDPETFRPERWGVETSEILKAYRRRKAKAEFISFHGGRRACLGERFALLEMRVTVFVLVRDLVWELDEGWEDKMTPAGPLCPRNLRLVIKRRESGEMTSSKT